MSVTRDVVQFARSNGGVFTTREAAALGMSPAMIYTRLGDGIFVRIGRGVFTLPGTSTRPDLIMRAACRILGAVVSHESAALVHRMSPIVSKIPTITVSHRSTHEFPGVIVHQSTDLLESHTALVNGVRVTIPERTIVDLAQVTGARRLERIVDNALAAGIVDLERLVALHDTLARRGKPGGKELRRILNDRIDRSVEKLSELELEFLELVDRAGLPKPLIQFHAPWLKPITGRVDFAYIAQRIVIEVDGRRWHVLNDAFETDRRRDNAAQLVGWIVLRFTWTMVTKKPSEVVSTIREAISVTSERPT